MGLADLIPGGEFHFQMRFERGRIADFFGPTPQRAPLLAERRRWLHSAPQTYAAFLPEGIPLLDEAIDLARALSVHGGERFPAEEFEGAPGQRGLALGQWWEPDYLLLKAGSDGQIRLWAGCVCFPSSWRLSEKMGQPIESIHGVVPGLNQRIGPQIQLFLGRLKPGVAWQRTNWGLSGSEELNQHPARALPPLAACPDEERIWFRVEHQALVALPRTGGILFGIRVKVHPLREVRADPVARVRLAHALTTMPEKLAEYKGLAAARSRIVEWLQPEFREQCL